MGTLWFVFNEIQKQNKPSTFPFDISSLRHDTLDSEHLYDRTKIMKQYFILLNIFFGSS